MKLRFTAFILFALVSGMVEAKGLWNPSQVTVRCASQDCPQGVGAAIFNHDDAFLVTCTATLIASDQILLPSSCTKRSVVDGGYFFVNINGQTQALELNLQDKVLDVFDSTGPMAPDIGVGEDLQILRLKTPETRLIPRVISRQIPPNMSQLVTYVANITYPSVVIEKETCTTEPHANDLSGSDDLKLGLKLNNCRIGYGSSGGPAFVPQDLNQIQVVINAAEFGNSDVATRAMGNRIQCIGGIPGVPDPAVICPRAFPPLR